MPMTDLSGRVAIVTGSGANIGEACARALAKAGATVILADIAAERAEAVARSIQASGGQAQGMALDLAQEDSITALVADVMRQHQGIDILHNNAADTRLEQMAADGSLLDLDAATWDRSFHVRQGHVVFL